MSDDDVEIITPPNSLKSKVTVGGPGAVDPQALERAEKAIASMTDDYLDWVRQDLIKIDAAFDALRNAEGERKDELDAVFQLAHDIKGQGGSFGYDLMTALGNQLCRMIERLDHCDDDVIDAIGVHIDSMKLVIGQDLKGDGGAAGEKMLAGLEKVYEKVLK